MTSSYPAAMSHRCGQLWVTYNWSAVFVTNTTAVTSFWAMSIFTFITKNELKLNQVRPKLMLNKTWTITTHCDQIPCHCATLRCRADYGSCTAALPAVTRALIAIKLSPDDQTLARANKYLMVGVLFWPHHHHQTGINSGVYTPSSSQSS